MLVIAQSVRLLLCSFKGS